MKNLPRFLVCVAASVMFVSCLTSPAAAQLVGTNTDPAPRQSPMSALTAPQPLPLVSVPLELLVAELGLSENQKTQVSAVQTKYRLPPNQSIPTGMDAESQNRRFAMLRMGREALVDGNRQIEALLTETQRPKLALFLQEQQDFDLVGIPVGTYAVLKLSAEQKSRLRTIASFFVRGTRPDGRPLGSGYRDAAQLQERRVSRREGGSNGRAICRFERLFCGAGGGVAQVPIAAGTIAQNMALATEPPVKGDSLNSNSR